MFLPLLAVTLGTALLVCWLVTCLFSKSISNVLERIVGAEMSSAWSRYVGFAVFVVGVGGGVHVRSLEKYVNPQSEDLPVIQLTRDRWILEVYRTVIESLQAIAWMLLVFFAFALVAYVIVRAYELRHSLATGEKGQDTQIPPH